jgi:hypothetical protein
MTVEQFVSVILALAALLGGLARVWVEVRRTHKAVNSRLDELVKITRDAAYARGQLAGPNPASGAPAPSSARGP